MVAPPVNWEDAIGSAAAKALYYALVVWLLYGVYHTTRRTAASPPSVWAWAKGFASAGVFAFAVAVTMGHRVTGDDSYDPSSYVEYSDQQRAELGLTIFFVISLAIGIGLRANQKSPYDG